jgi:energy-coupling factor transporter ATP-binding protein EcfA2
MPTDPTAEEYLAVVSEWSSYAQQSPSKVGNCYPIYGILKGNVVEKPLEEFPNPGYIFLVNRGELTYWDFIRVKPVLNARYHNRTERECYYIARFTPQPMDSVAPDTQFASLLDVASFDPIMASNQLRNPHQSVTPLFFVRNLQQKIYGPLRRTQVTRSAAEALESIHWAPYARDNLVYEFTADDLKKRNLKIVTYEHPNTDLNEVITRPINLITGPVLTATSDRAFDRLQDEQLAEWYLRWREMEDVPEAMLRTLKMAPAHLQDTTPDIIRQRCRKLSMLFSSLELLQGERRNLARKYLDSDEGKKVLQDQLALEIERRAREIDAEVVRRKSEVSAEVQKLSVRLHEVQEEHRKREAAVTADLRALEGRRSRVADEVTALESKLRGDAAQLAEQLREQMPLLAILADTRPTGNGVVVEQRVTQTVPARPAADWADVPVPAPTRALVEVKDEAGLVDHLTAELTAENLCFTRDFLANVYVTLKSSALNLIMGPPGHGKSSVIGAMARALGHGNALLEIAVRRSWSDDRYLLGFYDTFHGRYDPGPTGLATRLLQAQYDWDRSQEGLYFVLLDEFNLAAPEYYFSQLLQILTRPVEQRVLHLFDPASLPPEAGRVSRVAVNPNVSFWGTINYDETTERLSPRLLDRTGMIFLTARDVLPSLTPAEARARGPMKGVRAGQLVKSLMRPAAQCPDEVWENVAPLLEFLKQPTDECGPGIDLSPRVIDGIKRYLANSLGLLSPTRAVDFVFQQRVLPVLRGRGPKFAARVKALLDRLGERGLERCVRHVRDALALADVHFGDIDFLAY